MSILNWLGFRPKTAEPATPDDRQVERIADAMNALDNEEARYLAAFAYLLCRVAYADGVISRVETERMSSIMCDFSSLTPKQSDLVIKLAQNENFQADAETGRKVSAIFAEMAPLRARTDFIGCLYAVAAADEKVFGVEDESVMAIGLELGVSDEAVQRVRAAYARFIQL